MIITKSKNPKSETRRILTLQYWENRGFDVIVDSLNTILITKRNEYGEITQITLREYDKSVTALKIYHNESKPCPLTREQVRQVLATMNELGWGSN